MIGQLLKVFSHRDTLKKMVAISRMQNKKNKLNFELILKEALAHRCRVGGLCLFSVPPLPKESTQPSLDSTARLQ